MVVSQIIVDKAETITSILRQWMWQWNSGVLIGQDDTELAMFNVSKLQGISQWFCGFTQWELIITCQTRRHFELNSAIHCVDQ